MVMAPLCLHPADLIARASEWSHFMTRLETDWEHRRSTDNEIRERYKQYHHKVVYELTEYLWTAVRIQVFRPMLHNMVLNNLEYMIKNYDDMQAIRYAEELLTAFSSLQLTRFVNKKVPKPAAYTGLVSMFRETYGDCH